MDRFLVFDLGAGSGRAIVGSLDDGRIGLEEIYRFDSRTVFTGDELHVDVLRLYSEIKNGIEICEKKYGNQNIRSLAIDTWGCDFGYLDKKGRLLGNPIFYRDRKRDKWLTKLHEVLPQEDLFMLSGGPQDRIMSIYHLFAQKCEKDFEFENARHYLMIPDIMNYFLTGEIANEFTNATMGLLVNLNARQWETKIFSRLGFPEEIFTPLSEPGTRLGTLRGSVCEELGTRALPVILPPTHDTASAVAGIPVSSAGKRWAFGILGTWCMSGIETQRPVINEKVFRLGFGNEGGVEGRNMLLKNITGMWIIQQCREKWSRDAQRSLTWKEIDAVTKGGTGTGIYIDVDDGRFGAVLPDMPGAIAAFCRESGQKAPSDIGEFCCCFYESLALKFRKNFRILEELTGEKFELIRLIGGGVKNGLLCQWIANALHLPVTAGPTETTSVGNLIFQMKAAGVIGSVEEGRAIGEKSFELRTYEPRDAAIWDEKYSAYTRLFGE